MLGRRRKNQVPDEPPEGRSVAREDLERFGRLLRYAFPLGETGSFTGVLDAISKDPSKPGQ